MKQPNYYMSYHFHSRRREEAYFSYITEFICQEYEKHNNEPKFGENKDIHRKKKIIHAF